jgi:putative transposase
MARKLRIEYPGALYHVINRGNYRSWIFVTQGARHSFLHCLEDCCEAKGWNG